MLYFVKLFKNYENCEDDHIKNEIVDNMLYLINSADTWYVNYVDKKGITLLMAMICSKLSLVIFKLLPYMAKYKEKQVVGEISFRPSNPCGNTELMVAIRKKLNNIAMAMLDYPVLCELDKTNMFGDTALIVAIKAKEQDIAMNILKHTDKFDINYKNTQMDTALTIARSLNLEIAIEIEMRAQ